MNYNRQHELILNTGITLFLGALALKLELVKFFFFRFFFSCCVDGWMDGSMDGWVVIFYPLRFPSFFSMITPAETARKILDEKGVSAPKKLGNFSKNNNFSSKNTQNVQKY